MDDITLMHEDEFKPNPAYRSMTIENDLLLVRSIRTTGCIHQHRGRKPPDLTTSPPARAAISSNSSRTLRRNMTPGTSIPARSISANRGDRQGGLGRVGRVRKFTPFRVTRHLAELEVRPDHQPPGRSVDIDNDIDWHEKHVLLKAAFPLAVTSNFATYEIPYGDNRTADHAQQLVGKSPV